jgi:hypothetical protein
VFRESHQKRLRKDKSKEERVEGQGEKGTRDLHLFSRIKLEPARPDRRTGLQRNVDRVRQGIPPWLKETRLDRAVLVHASLGDFLPCARVRRQRTCEFIVPALRCGLQSGGGGRRSPAEGMGERLMLGGLGGDWGRGGQVRSFKVERREVLPGRRMDE